MVPALLSAANLLTLLVFSLEAAGYFGSQAVKVGEALWEGTSLHHLLLTLTAIWTVYAFVLVSVGRWRGWGLARAGGSDCWPSPWSSCWCWIPPSSS